MIAFGCSITKPDMYDAAAGKGIALAKEPDSLVLPISAAGSIFRSYNLIMERAAERDDLEALVLLHQDAEIDDPDFCAKLRAALADPDVGIVGCVGAIGVRSIAWWEGSVTWASFTHRYDELGGGDVDAFAWNPDLMPAYAQPGEVDSLDGFVLCLTPWAVRNLRFDEELGQLHGYDFDFCLQVREQGRKVVTADLRVVHHHSLELVSDPETWIQAHMKVTDKWEGRMPEVGKGVGDWKERARRAEADAAFNRLKVASMELQLNARVKQLEEAMEDVRHESREEMRREIEEMRTSIGWRLTEPLRRANALRRRAVGGRRRPPAHVSR